MISRRAPEGNLLKIITARRRVSPITKGEMVHDLRRKCTFNSTVGKGKESRERTQFRYETSR